MDPETSGRIPSVKSRHKASPLAIAGVLLIVLLSIFLGIFGPQISDYRRGQYVSGQPVVDLLRGISSVYFRESQKMSARSTRSRLSFDPVDQDELERSVITRFGSFDPPVLLQAKGFEVALINDAVDLTPFRRRGDEPKPGFAIFYLPVGTDLDPNIGTVLLIQKLAEKKGAIYLRNEFGIPTGLEEGLIYQDQVAGRGTQLSLRFWILDGFFYVATSSSQELLSAYMQSLSLNPMVPDPISSV